MRRVLFSLVVLGALLPGLAWAQGPGFNNAPAAGAAVQQSGSRQDACNLNITATGASGAAVTLTLPAAPFLFHYICALEVRQYAAAALTGGATPVLVTTTNFQGNPTFTFQTALAIGVSEAQFPFTGSSTPIKSLLAGTATTVVAPATTSVIWRLTAWYATNP